MRLTDKGGVLLHLDDVVLYRERAVQLHSGRQSYYLV